MNYADFLLYIPTVKTPEQRQTFKQKLWWTLGILAIYFVMTEVTVYGVNPAGGSALAQISHLLGATFGSLVTLGIGPIVTASIILQLLVGAKIINWDLKSHNGRVLFQGTQKILAIFFSIVEAAAYTLFGAVTPISYTTGMITLVIAQLALGGILVILLDEIVSKWGFGSGISLFIAAGVSKEIFVRAFSIIRVPGTEAYVGLIPSLLQSAIQGNFSYATFTNTAVPLISTVLVFLTVVYAQAMRVEIPLAFGSLRGFGRKWPLKFIYTSNMPVILTAALLINLRVWASFLANRGIEIFGKFDSSGNAISGLAYYISPPTTFVINILNGNFIFDEFTRVITYTIVLTSGSIMFSIFWVSTSGMDSRSVANQIQNIGMQIPGFRRDPRIMERVLERYIPALAILGGAFVGVLAALADITGALGSGTGILLTVMIIFNLYELLAKRHMEDMHPAMRKFFE